MNSGGGNRARKPRNPNMSHSNNNQRYSRPPRERPVHQDRPPVEASGVYSDAKYAHVLTSVLGCNVQLTTRTDMVYEGVLESVSKDNCFVLGLANPVHRDDPGRIVPSEVRDKLIFRTEQIVSVACVNVDMDYATKSGFRH